MPKAYAAKAGTLTGWPIGFPSGLIDEGYPDWPQGWTFPGPPWPPGWDAALYAAYLASLWSSYGSYGTGVGQFKSPRGKIAYDNTTGYLIIGDTGNHRIVKTKMDGTGWTTFGSYGTGINQFDHPETIIKEPLTDYFYVLDTYNTRIVKTDMTGSIFQTLNYKKLGGFSNVSVAYDSMDYDSDTGYFYLTDFYNYRIFKTKFDGSGVQYTNRTSTYFPYGNPVGCNYNKITGDIYFRTWEMKICKIKIDNSGALILNDTISGSYGGLGYNSELNKIFYDEYATVNDIWQYVLTQMNVDGTNKKYLPGKGAGIGERFNAINSTIYFNNYLFVTNMGDSNILKISYSWAYP